MITSIGDLAMSLVNRSSNARIRTEMTTLAQELHTGLKSDLRSALTGDLAPVSSLERSLSNLSAYDTANAETDLFLGGVQRALDQVSAQLEGLSAAAFDMDNVTNTALISNFGKDAESRFSAIATALNTTIAGRSIFAGNDTAAQPVANAGSILDELVALVPPAATAQDISDVVDGYFAPGAGFETNHYRGSDTPLGSFQLSPGDNMSFDVSAKSDALRAALGATAKAALLGRGALAGQPDEQARLIRASGLNLSQSNSDVIALRGDVGLSQARLGEAQARNGAERTAFELARADLIAADPFETATRLIAVQTQLETFYTVTARLSQLNLTGYLR